MLSSRIDWENTHVLELFAGTGSLGIECISRGAKNLLAVELSPVHVSAIKRNYQELNIANAQALRADAFKIINNIERTFELIVADPPFDHPMMRKIPDLIIESKILSGDGVLIVEHDRSANFSEHTAFEESRTFGHVIFSFFRNLKA